MFFEIISSIFGFLPLWILIVFISLVFLLLGILVFKLVAFVMDVLPFV